MNAWGGAWGSSWGAAWDFAAVIVPVVYGAIPAGAQPAERNERRPTVSSVRAPSINMTERNNAQTARRRN